MIGKLRIELKSGLCAGVGKHYAAIIDLDTALDELGIPYIPARRLKGCLREVFAELGLGDTNALFGVSGSGTAASLQISDARIDGYHALISGITKENAAKTAELFCTVRSETAIENDTVKDHSLRFIRVVNRYSPIDGKPLVFTADVTLPDDQKDDFEMICKGLRNIGYHRNRGFGAVRCTFVPEKSESFTVDPPKDPQPDAWYTLPYTVLLKDDLMIPADSAAYSRDYIPGTSVLGAFASRYSGTSFNKIFLSGDVQFGNLYVTDDPAVRYTPAPRFLGKIKAATEQQDLGIKNLIAKKETDTRTYKALKKGYINDSLTFLEPKRKIVYHNAIQDGGGLYMQYCLCAGQYFSGTIRAKGKWLAEISALVEKDVSFGRSKTAQYAHCTVQAGAGWQKESEKMIELKAGSIAAYVCESDVFLTNENGIAAAAIRNLCAELGVAQDKLHWCTSLMTRTISGYNAKWNLKKPQYPAIRAGSVIVFNVSENDTKPVYQVIGEYTQEGFGRVRLIADANKLEQTKKTDGSTKDTTADDIPDKPTAPVSDPLAQKLAETELDDALLLAGMELARKVGRLEKAQLGRVTLMREEADTQEDFMARLGSIKTDSTRETALLCFKDVKDTVDALIESHIHAEVPDAFREKKYKKYSITALLTAKYQKRGE